MDILLCVMAALLLAVEVATLLVEVVISKLLDKAVAVAKSILEEVKTEKKGSASSEEAEPDSQKKFEDGIYNILGYSVGKKELGNGD